MPVRIPFEIRWLLVELHECLRPFVDLALIVALLAVGIGFLWKCLQPTSKSGKDGER